MQEGIHQFNLEKEDRSIRAERKADEAMRDVKDLRREILKIEADMLERLKENKQLSEHIRDMHVKQTDEMRRELSEFKLSVTEMLGKIQAAIDTGTANSKWHKTLIWFVFVEIFVLILGVVSTIVAKALIQVI